MMVLIYKTIVDFNQDLATLQVWPWWIYVY
jgi:hypothetical protein